MNFQSFKIFQNKKKWMNLQKFKMFKNVGTKIGGFFKISKFSNSKFQNFPNSKFIPNNVANPMGARGGPMGGPGGPMLYHL